MKSTMHLSLIISIFYAAAASADYKNILGNFNGHSYAGGPNCAIYSAQSAEGMMLLEISVDSQELTFPKFDPTQLEKAIEAGFEGQFTLNGPKKVVGLLGSDSWNLSGAIYTEGPSTGKLSFLRIQHEIYEGGFFRRDGLLSDLSCSVNEAESGPLAPSD